MVFSIRSFAVLAPSNMEAQTAMKLRGACFGLALMAIVSAATAQTPVIVPNTISTIAGSTPVASTGSSACPTNSQFTAQDTVGNGCPAVNATLSGAEKAITVDPQGNVYIASDTNNPQYVRRIDARTGNISIFAGPGANGDLSSTAVTYYGTLYTPLDKEGDGLPVVYSGGFYSTRGLGSDPYGNIFIGTVGSDVLHVVCTAVSPICSAAAVRVNLLLPVAGCTYSSAQYGVAVAGTTPGTAGDGGPATQVAANSSSCTIGTHGPATVTADKWDNVYFMDRSNGRIRVVAGAASVTVNGASVTNPLTATLLAGGYTLTQGNIYPIAGGGTVCAGKTDSGGDGCPFTQTVINTGNSGATVQGLAVDPDGDFIFDDGNGYLRVIYEGGVRILGALAANGISNPTVGTSYRLIGGGTTYYYNSSIAAPILGSSFQLQSQYQTLAVDPGGNIYISDQEQILFFDIATGYVRRIGTSGTSCNSTAYGDGCPISQAVYGVASSPLPIALDTLGNLYMIDAASTAGHKLIRMVSATILPGTALNGSQSSSLIVHAPSTGSSVAITAGSSADFTVGSAACVTNTSTDKSVDCTATVTYAPKSLAQRAVPVSISTTVGSTTTTQNLSLTGNSTGTALVFDTVGAPSLTTLGAGATGNTAVVLDRSGNLYVRGTQGISKIAGSSVINIAATAYAYLAADASGNLYATSSGSASVTKYTYSAATGSYIMSSIAIPSIPINGTGTQAYGGPIAVDSDGVLYLTDLTNKQVVKFVPGAATGQQLTQTALISPTAMAQDSYGNLLVLDGTSVLKIPSAGVPFSTASTSAVPNPTVSFPTALTAPTAIAADQAENIYVTDSGNLVVRSLSGNQYTLPLSGPVVPTAPLPSSANVASTTTLTLTNAADTLSGALSIAVGSGSAHTITLAAGSSLSALAIAINADSTYAAESVTAALSGNVLTVSGPATAASTLAITGTSLTETTAIAGGAAEVAVDGAGDIYVAGSTVAGVSKLLRNAEAHVFGTDVSDPYVGLFMNTGATAATGFTQTDTGGNYAVAAPATGLASGAPTCVLASTALTGGAICNASITFSPTSSGSGDTPNVLSLLPGSNTLGALSLDGTKNGSTATTTTTITGNTTGLVYSTGTETTFTVTVTQSAGSPSGVVSVSIDGAAGVNYTLGTASGSSAAATVSIAGLKATTHSIAASYAGSSGIAGSSTQSPTSFSIAQASTTVSWTPAVLTLQYSAPLGLSVLNATASAGGTSVPGTFVYTANATEVNAASYLAIGTYALATTFYPTDAIDYSGSTGSVSSNLTVQKAGTTAAIGGSQFVVGSTGNYSSVQSAVNALPVTGGSVYIQPGTYTGDVTVTQPNVALRGLGGDPTKVVITHPGGAFSNNPGSVYNYAGEFTTAISNGYQLPSGSSLFSGDQGSATLVVARGINTAVSSSTTTPNGFYGEYLTLNNTWDTDSTTTTTYVSGGVCTANAGAAMTYSALYNAGSECASQALAIWITSDNAVLNNVYTSSLQDTVYAGAISTGSGYPARQFWFRGKITGDVDYIFGDAAAVFDHTSIYSAYHSTAGGTVTIEAQNQAQQYGSGSYYLSGYVMNGDVFTSQNSGMGSLYFGRPYGVYSTWIMLNSYIDQVNSAGYIPFSGSNALTGATYGEYNDHAYTDPSNGSPDLNGVIFNGTSGANSGSGVLPTSARENASTDPGITAFNANTTNSVGMTQAQAQPWYPLAFLGATVATNSYNTVATWDPTAAIAAGANGFVPSSSPSSITAGQSITLLMRPQTPGLGAVSNGVYTIPTGTYVATENGNTIASGTLDASGSAYLTVSTLTPGVHKFQWTYSGDSNFAGSTTATPYSLTVNGPAAATTTSLSASTNPATYGQTVTLTATVQSSGSAVTVGTVTFTVDGATVASYVALNGSGQAIYSASGLAAGSHSFTATYNGSTSYSTSFSATVTDAVNQAPLTITATCSNRIFGAANVCTAGVSGYQNGDSAATVFGSAPTVATAAVRTSPANTYTATVGPYTLTASGSANYAVTAQSSTFTVSGGAAQLILFAALPNFPSGGSYQLTASTTSGLPITYIVTAGSANISNGSTLNVTGPGLVTVQATQTVDPTGDYAAAAAVSRSFTAQ